MATWSDVGRPYGDIWARIVQNRKEKLVQAAAKDSFKHWSMQQQPHHLGPVPHTERKDLENLSSEKFVAQSQSNSVIYSEQMANAGNSMECKNDPHKMKNLPPRYN